LHGGNEENHEELCEDSWSPDRDSNPGPPEYEARLLTIRRHSVAEIFLEVVSLKENADENLVIPSTRRLML
jgi:hypothetical protein